MAISRVQTKVNSPGTSNASSTVTFDVGPTQGNLLIAKVGMADNDANSTTPTASGWSLAVEVGYPVGASGFWRYVALLWKIAGAGESATVATSWTNAAFWEAEVVEVTESAGGVWALDKTTSNSATSGTAFTTGTTAATTQAAEYALAALETGGAQTFSSPLNGYTTFNDGSSRILMEKILSATGAQSTGITGTTSEAWAMALATFKCVPLGVDGANLGRDRFRGSVRVLPV